MSDGPAVKKQLDTATTAGIALAIFSIVGTHLFEGGHMSQIVQPSAGLIVLGGSVACGLNQFSSRGLRLAVADLWLLIRPDVIDVDKTSAELMELAKLARRKGMVAIDREAQKLEDPFMQRAMRMTADGVEPKALREALEFQVDTLKHEEMNGAELFEAMGGYAPTIGVLGAVLGLIHVMGHLTEPEKLGAGIAVAFVATLYGVGFANLFFLPMGNKLANLAKARMRNREMVIEGAVSIAAGENPMVTEQKLASFSHDALHDAGGKKDDGPASDASEAA